MIDYKSKIFYYEVQNVVNIDVGDVSMAGDCFFTGMPVVGSMFAPTSERKVLNTTKICSAS